MIYLFKKKKSGKIVCFVKKTFDMIYEADDIFNQIYWVGFSFISVSVAVYCVLFAEERAFRMSSICGVLNFRLFNISNDISRLPAKNELQKCKWSINFNKNRLNGFWIVDSYIKAAASRFPICSRYLIHLVAIVSNILSSGSLDVLAMHHASR